MYNKNCKSLCFVMLKPWWAGNKIAIKYLLPNHYQWVSDFKYGWIISYIAWPIYTLRSSAFNEILFLNCILFHAFEFIYLWSVVCGPGARPCLFARCVKNIFLQVDIFDYKWLHHDIFQGDKMAAWKLFPCQMASISYRHFVKTKHSFCKRHSKKCLVLRVCHS